MVVLKLVVGWSVIGLIALSLVGILAAAWQQEREKERVRLRGRWRLVPSREHLAVAQRHHAAAPRLARDGAVNRRRAPEVRQAGAR